MANRLPLRSRATGLRARIALAVVIAVVALGFAAAVAIQFTLVSEFHDLEDAHAVAVAHNLALASEDAVLLDDTIAIRRLMDRAMESEPRVVYAFAVDPEGELIASTFAEGLPADLAEANVLPSGGGDDSELHLDTDQGPVLDVAVPLLGGQIGTMHAGLSERGLQDTLATVRLMMGGVTLLIASLGAVMAYVSGRLITRPLEVLVDTACEVRDGDLTKRAEVVADPEIGLLAESFNEMVERLEADIAQRKQAEAEMWALAKDLDHRVEERTHELAKSNQELASVNVALTSTNEELFETVARLEESNRLLTEATSAKSRFLASMSHELRTPLNSIIGFSGILLQGLAGPLSEEQETQVSMINSSGKHLLALINDVLDLTRVEAGHLVPKVREFDVIELAHQSLESVRPLAEDRGLELTLVADARCSSMHSDPERVMQILVNLLGNAVKFTREGAVTLEVRCTGGDVLLAVADTGPGIPPEEQAAIFEEFYQIEDRNLGKPTGTGLGLPVSRRIARVLGGDITIASNLGGGSEFTLRLPCRLDIPAPDHAVSAAAEHTGAS